MGKSIICGENQLYQLTEMELAHGKLIQVISRVLALGQWPWKVNLHVPYDTKSMFDDERSKLGRCWYEALNLAQHPNQICNLTEKILQNYIFI